MNRLPMGTILSRALRLRCPRCGEGKLFTSWFRMHETCVRCGLKYERGPGYFLGSAYVNYGVTAALITLAYLWLVFGLGLDKRIVLWPLLAFVVVFPLAFFRYARSLWLAMDFYFDVTDFQSDAPDDRPSL